MKPILFNTEMVKAILAGRKTQTRRPVGEDCRGEWEAVNDVRENSEDGASVPCYLHREISVDDKSRNIMYPKYDMGDILYVRETFASIELPSEEMVILYKASRNAKGLGHMYYGDGEKLYPIKWKPSIHMPKEAARIFLRVTGAKVEQLQEITEEGAEKEGVKAYGQNNCSGTSARIAFAELWDSVYGTWRQNPWVWVIGFDRISKEGSA